MNSLIFCTSLMPRAASTPLLTSTAHGRTARTASGFARPCSSRCRASVSISALATTAPSAIRAASAAWSGVRTPKPIAIGSAVCRLMRGIASASYAPLALRVPVMPVIAT